MDLQIGQILTQIFAFLIMLWVLKKFGWKPIQDMLEQRKRKIQSEFDKIEEQKKSFRLKQVEYEARLMDIEKEGRHQIQEAINEGKKIAREIEEEAKENSKQIFVKAQENIHHEIANAKNQLKNDIVNLVILTTQKLLKTTLDEKKQRELITNIIDEAK